MIDPLEQVELTRELNAMLIPHTQIAAIQQLIEREAAKTQTKAFKAGYERAWYDRSHGLPHRYADLTNKEGAKE